MIKARLLSGSILGLMILLIVILAPNQWFALACCVLFGIAAWEWARLTSQSEPIAKVSYLGATIALFGLLWSLRNQSVSGLWLGMAVVFWAALSLFLRRYHRDESTGPRWQWSLALAGLIVIPAAWLAFVKLHAIHYGWLLYVLILAASADSFAFLIGKLMGRHKLAPELSPGKTLEGFMGGMMAVFLLSLLTAWWVGFSGSTLLVFVLLSLITGLLSVEGDLFESLIKREAGVKDSGTILPGHGGILDRFDSHLAAAPLFYLGLHWMILK